MLKILGKLLAKFQTPQYYHPLLIQSPPKNLLQNPKLLKPDVLGLRYDKRAQVPFIFLLPASWTG